MIERTRIEGVADAKQRNEIPTPPLKSLNSLAADAVDAADAKIGTFCTGEKKKTFEAGSRTDSSPPNAEPLRDLGLVVAHVISEGFGRQVVNELLADAGEDGLIGYDAEMMARPEAVARLAAIRDRTEDKTLKGAARRLIRNCPLHPRRGDIRLVQLYAGGSRVGVFDMTRVPWSIFDPIWSRPLVMHNAGFDLSFLMARGIEPLEVHCTMQAVRLLRGHGNASLKDAAAHFLGLDIPKDLQRSDWSAPDLSVEQINYAALDAVVPWQLADLVFDELGDAERAYEIAMAATMPAIRMMLRGVLPDMVAHATLSDSLRQALPVAERAYLDACEACGRSDLRAKGIPDTTAKAEALLDDILNDKHHALWKRTKTGKLMTGKNIISPVRKTYPPIDALLTHRQIRKQLETYGEGWALFVNSDTSRIHSTFNVFGALTGRASNSQPNLQQLPKRQPIKGLASYRSLVVAGPGNVLVDVDYDQMELRILAALSRDSAMLAVFDREDEIGRDLHRATAAAMLGIRPEDVTDEQRGWGKTVNFAQAYGQSPRGLMNRMLVLCDKVISEAEAEAWRYTFRRTYPQFAQWSDDRISMSDARRKIEISSGRFFEYSWGKPDAYHGNQAVNLPVQGTGADIGMHGLALIDERLRAANIKGGLILWVHDEYLLEVAKADASLTAEITENAMCEAFLEFLPNGPVKGIVSAKIGPSWSETK